METKSSHCQSLRRHARYEVPLLDEVVQKFAEHDAAYMFGMGASNTAFDECFIGENFLNLLTDPQNGESPLFNVTLASGFRNM